MDAVDIFSVYSGYKFQHNTDRRRGWMSSEPDNLFRRDPRLTRRDGEPNLYNKSDPLFDKWSVPLSPMRKRYSRSPSPHRLDRNRHKMPEGGSSPKSHSSYGQSHSNQSYQQPVYNEGYAGYPPGTYQQGYGQHYPGYGQYEQSGYGGQQGYNSSHLQQPPAPGEYPGGWAPVSTSYLNPPGSSMRSAPPGPPAEPKPDDGKKEAAIAQELKQQRATLHKQREEYLRKMSVLRREFEKLRVQKLELLSERSPTRDSQRILRENAKLQLEIQNKLKSISNVVDMLSGIIGDGLEAKEEERTVPSDNSPIRHKAHHKPTSGSDEEKSEWPRYNYVHFDPEMHWCRSCDVFPQTAKDYLNHLHSAEHRQVTQEHQLVDTPWHKLATDQEFPTVKGAPNKRVPIKGLPFLIPATAWYCKLCDSWIGDLHCASQHLKSKTHSHNFSNFVEQNPNWEAAWKKDREKAYMRCLKNKINNDAVPQPPEPPSLNDKNKRRKEKLESTLFDIVRDKKKKRRSKKRKHESSGSSSSSSSSDSSSEEDSDRSKSIRVAMRNKMIQAQRILNEEIGDKWEVLGRLVEEGRIRNKESAPEKKVDTPNVEDQIINQWMTVNNNSGSNDKLILESLKGRLKQKQEADKDKILKANNEQRKRERDREERELKELREREQKEQEDRIRQEREHEERERIKERERNRRKKPNELSPERFIGRRSLDRKNIRKSSESSFRSNEMRNSPPESKFKVKSLDELSKHEPNDKQKDKKSSSGKKLPFIGRMPLFKKKGDGDEKEIQNEDYEFRPSKFEHGSSARAFIPAPGVVHITKLATPNPMPLISADNPPPPPNIIPEPPRISMDNAPPPPRIKDVVTTLDEGGDDMELDDNQVGPLPPGVPLSEGKPLAKPAGNHLPRDFQDALNIIFPGDQNAQADPNMLAQYHQYYGMMYPGMHMYDYNSQNHESVNSVMMNPRNDDDELMPEPPPKDDKEDLAMLGIDVGDMAAQTI